MGKNPFQMFDMSGGGNPGMYQIGYQQGPGGGIAQALRGTIDKYHASLAAQQEQVYKQENIASQSKATYQNAKQLAQDKFDMTAPDPAIATQHDPNDMTKNTFDLGGVQMYYAPQTDAHGRIKGWAAKNPRALSMMDIMQQDQGANSADVEVENTLRELESLRNSLPEGM